MLAISAILIMTLLVIFYVPNYQERREKAEQDGRRESPQLKKLWSIAQVAIDEHKPLKAEKALLTILKFDEKNAAAYNRLGIIYAREKHYKEAIDCFEIAQSLDNNASSLHNVGLIYLETGKYEKAAMAFKQAIAIEGDQPGRYIAYAKALERLGERAKALAQLETAYSLNPTTVILRHILDIYEISADEEGINATKLRIAQLEEEKRNAAKKKKAPKIKSSTTKAAKPTKAPKSAKVSKSVKRVVPRSGKKPNGENGKTLA